MVFDNWPPYEEVSRAIKIVEKYEDSQLVPGVTASFMTSNLVAPLRANQVILKSQ